MISAKRKRKDKQLSTVDMLVNVDKLPFLRRNAFRELGPQCNVTAEIVLPDVRG